jgi:hypothetical protein
MKKQTKSWLDKKLRNLKFKQGFEQEIEKLSIAEQLLRLRLQSGLTQAQLAKKGPARQLQPLVGMKMQSMIAMNYVL